MTETHTDPTDAYWALRPAPYQDDAEVIITAWSTDEQLARLTAELEPVYGTVDQLHAFRAYLRRLAVTAAEEALVREVVEKVGRHVHGNLSDDALDALAAAVEAGYGAPLPGLRRELELFRAAERAAAGTSEPPSGRDAEILRRTVDGESARSIGLALGMSKSTALRHVRRVREEAGLPPAPITA